MDDMLRAFKLGFVVVGRFSEATFLASSASLESAEGRDLLCATVGQLRVLRRYTGENRHTTRGGNRSECKRMWVNEWWAWAT